MKKPIVTAILLASSLSAFALDKPDYSRYDRNIQFTNYNHKDVVKVVAFPGKVSQVQFDKGEHIQEVYSGFDDGWELISSGRNLLIKARTVSASVDTGTGKPSLVPVQPTPKDWRTNVIVITNKRNYAFELHLGYSWQMPTSTYRLTFSYPEEEKARQKALVQADKDRELMKALKDKKPDVKNNDYWMQVGKNSKNIAPTEVYDDGRFTYVTLSNDAEIPAAYYVYNKKEHLVNFHIHPDRPNTLVIRRLAEQMVLRLDDSVVGITNKGFGEYSESNKSRSTVPGMKRTVKGE
ncbi:P-type conjugative transfer protein VirB9 [Flavobacteriaceae bacterium (ex Bugula neritina AB1)]|nr:P-type conjugative transfer protein VirB9 [Flavobacteriaceae bacterium (ex Bugula neritina AB1)]